jgi:hypothetical protein
MGHNWLQFFRSIEEIPLDGVRVYIAWRGRKLKAYIITRITVLWTVIHTAGRN